jgi:hypothetical protein
MRSRTNFPKNPNDGDEVVDTYGTRYRYEEQTRSWLTIGSLTTPQIASEEADGLVDSDLYQKLDKIKRYVDNGGQFSSLKLRPGTDAYYYLFRSSDKTIRFTPEPNNVVRIEVDEVGFTHFIAEPSASAQRAREAQPAREAPTDDPPGSKYAKRRLQ